MKNISRAITLGSISAWGVFATTVPAVFAQAGTVNIGFDEKTAIPDSWFKEPSTLISGLINVAFVVAVLLVFFYLVMGGIDWITSGGEKSKTEGARNKITAAIIGLIVLAASYAILQLALSFLGTNAGAILGGGSGSPAGAGAGGSATSVTAQYTPGSLTTARTVCPRANDSATCLSPRLVLASNNAPSISACVWNRLTNTCTPRYR
jgi:hypothetical protein